MALSSRFTSSMLSTAGILRSCRVRTSLRASSGRSSVCVKKKRSAETIMFIVGTGNAGILLLDLETAHVLGGRGVRRAPQPRREPLDVADIIVLRLGREPAHGHVVDKALTKRADQQNGDNVVHLKAP